MRESLLMLLVLTVGMLPVLVATRAQARPARARPVLARTRRATRARARRRG